MTTHEVKRLKGEQNSLFQMSVVASVLARLQYAQLTQRCLEVVLWQLCYAEKKVRVCGGES